ncbi:hypothetical protein GCM10009582_02280 [Arthrobacter flavus]
MHSKIGGSRSHGGQDLRVGGKLAEQLKTPETQFLIRGQQITGGGEHSISEEQLPHQEFARGPAILGNSRVARFKQRVMVPQLVLQVLRLYGQRH